MMMKWKRPTIDWNENTDYWLKMKLSSCLCDYPITCPSIGSLIGNERPSRTSLWSKGLLKMLYSFRAWGSCWLVSFLCCQGHWKYRSCLSDHLTICLSIWLSNENVDYRLKEMPFLSIAIGPSDYLSVFLTIDWIENYRLTIEIAVPVYRSCLTENYRPTIEIAVPVYRSWLTVPVNSRGLRWVCQSIPILVRKGAFPG